MNEYLNNFWDKILEFLPEVVLAVATLFIGFFLTNKLVRFIKKVMKDKKMDETLIPFMGTLIGIGLKVLILISVITMVGVKTTSFVALIGAMGLAFGVALSGTLQNFAGGAMIMIFKPIKVGEYIEANGHGGVVKEIQIFQTIILSLDNKRIYLPNGPLSNGTILNYTREKIRRIDWPISVSYGENVVNVKLVLKQMTEKESRILKDPNTKILVNELADSSIHLIVRSWVKTEDYWDVYFDIYHQIYISLNKAKINIPFPQLDINLTQKIPSIKTEE